MNYRMLSILRRQIKNTIPELLLFVCWSAGLSLGFLAERFYGGVYSSFIDVLPVTIAGLDGLILSLCFPLLLSACAVSIFGNSICFGCCFLRGLSQGLMIAFLVRCYGYGAPLIVLLLLFSGLCLNLLLFFFWMRRFRAKQRCMNLDLLLGLLLCLIIALADHFIVTPFLVDVIYFS